jgi:hypothetical protein
MILLKKPLRPLTFTGESKSFNVYGKSLYKITNVYLSGLPYRNVTFYNPFSAVSNLSAFYPGFTALRLDPSQYTFNNDNTLTFQMPPPIRTGFVDIIIENRAGYGSLTQYVINDLYSGEQTQNELRRWSTGIIVLTGENIFMPLVTINGDELFTINEEQMVTVQSY